MKKFLFLFLAVTLTAFPFCSRLAAQGEDNPTGVTGVYNGNSTVGCSVDPYTQNELRMVEDIPPLPGSVGAYPLKWTRYYNSRHQGGIGWTFSYGYGRDETGLIVSFPDGREISWWDSDPAVEERLGGGGILLPDGGKVLFTGYASILGHSYYKVSQLIDPYGQVTTISYDIVGYNSEGYPIPQLSRITEPGGRYLQITWDSVLPYYNRSVTSVQAFDGRGNLLQSVTYTYTDMSGYKALTRADYSDGTFATYSYVISGGTKRPFVVTADDVRYSGPMRQIAYVGPSSISKEKKLTGEVVTTITANDTVSPKLRTETRGDGATRTFHYGGGTTVRRGKLLDYTDFQGHTTTLTYPGGYLETVTDANNRTTTYTRGLYYDNAWAIFKITYPDGSFMEQTYTDTMNPYYLASRTARRGPSDPARTTTYTRDTNNRITHKAYPDGGYEDFTYNSFGQVLTHSRAQSLNPLVIQTESFAYDTRGLKTSSTDALGNITTYSYYSPGDANFPAWADRLKTVTRPVNISNQIQTETYEYDKTFDINGVETATACGGRGLVTKVTHTDGSYVATTHNKWGDVLTTRDENNNITTNTYDDYGRVLTTTDALSHTTSISYLPWGKTSSYITTSKLPFVTTLPSTKKTNIYYDTNWRKSQIQQAPATVDEANSYFTYDNVGNLLTSKDPRNNITTNHYDVCDRVDSVTAPAPFNYVTTFEYYLTGNKKKETPPNGGWTSFDSYDAMNRLTQKTHHRDATTNDVTTMQYDLAGNLWKSWDERGNLYQYSYDLMNRRTSMIYPDVTKHEDTAYDAAGNMKTYTNRNGKAQSFTYDNRNRQTGFSWNDSGATPSQTMTYDLASRVTQIANSKTGFSSTINHTYYNDNRLNTEEEWTSAYNDNVHRTVTYQYDADGNRLTVQYPSGSAFNYTYTNRNQVSAIKPGLSGGTAVVSYVYDLSGNITTRTLDNSTSSAYTVDQVNRETAVVHNLVGGAKRFDYAYNNVNDITAVRRDSNNSDGDGYEYDLTQQITKFHQKGTVDLATGIVTNPATDNSLEFDGCGNRTKLNGVPLATPNNMNQPTDAGILYDQKGNLQTWNSWAYTYDAQNRLTNATKTGTTALFYYDGKNRQIARSINGAITFSVWDDWELVEEYTTGNVRTAAYLQGAHGPVKSLLNNVYYYQDSLGSTSHIADSSGALVEYYKYNLYGKPTVWRNGSEVFTAPVVNDLFSGERWISEMSMYDLRNRFYSPDLGRFLQPDPIGFKGDASNLYRYCGNDWANKTDPMGLTGGSIKLTADQIKQISDQAINYAVDVVRQMPAAQGVPDAKLVEMAREIVKEAVESAKLDATDPGKTREAARGGDPTYSKMSETRRDGGYDGKGRLQVTDPKQGYFDSASGKPTTAPPDPTGKFAKENGVFQSHDHLRGQDGPLRWHTTQDLHGANNTANGGRFPLISTVSHQSDKGRVVETYIPSANIDSRAENREGRFFYSNDGVTFRDHP